MSKEIAYELIHDLGGYYASVQARNPGSSVTSKEIRIRNALPFQATSKAGQIAIKEAG